MKAISIRQPWAHAILHYGKDIENRGWGTRYRGPVLLHASKGMERMEFEDAKGDIADILGFRLKDDLVLPALQFGGIVGRAEIVDCVTESASPWFFGRYGFVLRNVEPVPFRPCKGALGFFEPDFNSRYVERPRRSPRHTLFEASRLP